MVGLYQILWGHGWWCHKGVCALRWLVILIICLLLPLLWVVTTSSASTLITIPSSLRVLTLRVLASVTCIIIIPWFVASTTSFPTTGPMGAIPKIILMVITITSLTLSGSWVIVTFITSPILSLWIPLFGGSCILCRG